MAMQEALTGAKPPRRRSRRGAEDQADPGQDAALRDRDGGTRPRGPHPPRPSRVRSRQRYARHPARRCSMSSWRVPVLYLLALDRLSDRLQRRDELSGGEPRQHRRASCGPSSGSTTTARSSPTRPSEGLRQLARLRRRSMSWRRSGSASAWRCSSSQQFPGAHFMRGLLLAPGCCRRWSSARCGNGFSPREYGVANFVLSALHADRRADPLAVRSCGGADLRHARQHLVRHAVQHDPDRRGADRDPAGALRGCGARRRGRARALPLHHPAGAEAGAARRRAASSRSTRCAPST